MTQMLCLEPPSGLRRSGNGQSAQAINGQNRFLAKESLISGGVGGKVVITESALKPPPETIRAIRGKYAYLGISVDEFMEERRRDAERGY
jgi:hypothetical protein